MDALSPLQGNQPVRRQFKRFIFSLLLVFAVLSRSVVAQIPTQEQLQAADAQLNQVYQQLRVSLNDTQKQQLKLDQRDWIKKRDAFIASNSGNPQGAFYQATMERVAVLQKVFQQIISNQVAPSANKLGDSTHSLQNNNSSAQEKDADKYSRDQIEGVNTEGERWAYEFLTDKSSGKSSIVDNPSGQVIFQNTEWIVKKIDELGNVGRRKTDLFFYDSRTLELVASAQIPNSVIKVGMVGRLFYVLTITPGKYHYDDAPLAICLVDPKSKEIDRLKIVENDYWFAQNNPIKVYSEGNTIQIGYDPLAQPSGIVTPVGKQAGYLKSLPKNPHFSGIKLSFYPESKAILDSDQIKLNDQANNGLASLQSVGINPTLKEGEAYLTYDGSSATYVTNGASKGLHFVRSTRNGFIQDLCLDALTSKSLKVADTMPEFPGIFSNGTLRCIVNQQLLILRKTQSVRIDIPRRNVSFDGEYAYASDMRIVSNPVGISFFRIDASGIKQVIDVPRINSDPGISDFCLFLDQGTTFTLQNDGGGNLFKRYSLSDGKQIGRKVITESGRSGYVNSIKDGKAPDGWRVLSAVTDNSTLGAGYSVIAQTDDGQTELRFPGEMPYLADPLEMRINKDGIFQILQSYAGITKYSEYTDATKGSVIAEWKSPRLDGNPLLVSEKNLIFIPKPGGYKAYRIFGEGKPEKIFEIYFRGSSDYVILLPNGFYAGSPGCEKLIKIPSNGSLVDASSLAPWKNRPAEVVKALGGDPKTADLLSKVTERWLKRSGFDPSSPEPAASEIAKVSVPQMPPLWAPSSRVSFPIEATSGGEPLKEVIVRVNGVIQKSFTGNDLNIPSGKHTTLNASVTLAEGQNWIEVTATDAKGRPGNLEHFRTILPKASESPKRYIIAMGCSEYDRPELNLQFAAKDAGDVLKTFSQAGGRDCKTLLLTNKEVGPEALDKIKAFTAGTKESDEVILFCAGHGLLDEHLDYVYAGHQIDPVHPGQTGIKLDALLDSIGSGKSLKRLVLMDTCQAGTVGEQEEMKLAQNTTDLPHGVRAIKSRGLKVVGTANLSGSDQQRFIEEMFLLPGQHRGINIIGASGGAEYAMESDKWNNGVFTSALIEAMRDKKADLDHRGRISVSDLKTYLSQRVPELTGGAQKPSVVAFEQDQDFELSDK